MCSRTSLGQGELLIQDAVRSVFVYPTLFSLPRWVAPQTGGVPADGNPTLKLVGWPCSAVRTL